VEGGDIDVCDCPGVSGGVDIHPSFYGGVLNYGIAAMEWRPDGMHLKRRSWSGRGNQGKPVWGLRDCSHSMFIAGGR